MESGLITYEQLLEYTGYTEARQIRKWLRDNGIQELPVPGKRGRPCTTLKAINAALGLECDQPNESRVRHVQVL